MKEKHSIMSACDYAVHTLQGLRRGMVDIGSPNQKIAWAIGSLIVALTSNLLKICQETIEDAAKNPVPNARQDLLLIKEKFNSFMDRMLENE